ncbi:hypothetical protein ETAA8_68740 [Anatilimnocola aggregata]|uniref:Uncharacterized protein n=1 Tax=Anatilimnocola aggregata TaxID=2528021 RepID=A0A517YNC0_9BACT|nr:hypothetical protein ETAA8_68740 [Anatilimnocola aggregata]
MIAALLLLLPVLYVGSYFAMVTPGRVKVQFGFVPNDSYRAGAEYCEFIFWPLEQIDRRLRPAAWEVDLDFRFTKTSRGPGRSARLVARVYSPVFAGHCRVKSELSSLVDFGPFLSRVALPEVLGMCWLLPVCLKSRNS